MSERNFIIILVSAACALSLVPYIIIILFLHELLCNYGLFAKGAYYILFTLADNYVLINSALTTLCVLCLPLHCCVLFNREILISDYLNTHSKKRYPVKSKHKARTGTTQINRTEIWAVQMYRPHDVINKNSYSSFNPRNQHIKPEHI